MGFGLGLQHPSENDEANLQAFRICDKKPLFCGSPAFRWRHA
jgi:hypothetical protein